MAHHTLRVQWFGNTWLTKHDKENCLNVSVSPNDTYTMVLVTHSSHNVTNTLVWLSMARQALHIQLCGGALVTKPYKYISLNIHGSTNVTYPKVYETWLSNPYKYNCFPNVHCFQHFSTFSRLSSFYRFSCFSRFSKFLRFPTFPLTAFPGSVAGARLTAFPEVRFMRCAVHGSNLNTMKTPAQLSKKPSYQRWTRLQPMLETLIKSLYDRALAPADF